MRLSRPLAALATSLALAAGLVGLPDVASASTHAVPTVVSARHGDHGRSPVAKVRRFELKGTITAVDADEHTMTVEVRVKRHGRSKLKLTRTVDLVTAADARIRLNGAPAAEGDLQVGDRVKLNGLVQKNDDGTRTLVVTRLRAFGSRDAAAAA